VDQPSYQGIEVERLLLDTRNPRLPETLVGADRTEVLDYLVANGVLEELAQSFIDNGYFRHEPMIATPEAGSDRFVVLEGNRRLATLQILLNVGTGAEVDYAFTLDPRPTVEQLNRIRVIPCFVVDSPEAVHAFLGFRHIGGLKMWSPEAKARFILTEVERTLAQNPSDPNVFRTVGRRVGSNAQGVRNQYVAIKILLHARDEFGISTTWLQRHRFGVWTRMMNSGDLRRYIGFGTPRTYQGVVEALNDTNEARLAEVIDDLSERDGRKAVVADSRDVTVYAQVLVNTTARQVLRETGDLRVARQVVERAGLSERLETVIRSVRVILDQVQEFGGPPDVLDAVDRLSKMVRSLSAAAHELIADDEH
jgi:hypothetical protein